MKKVIKLSAQWCSPCRAIAPMFKELKSEFANKIQLEDIDVDNNPEIALKYDVTSIPTILFLEGEVLVNSHKGALTKSALKAEIEKFLK